MAIVVVTACGKGQDNRDLDSAAHIVELPGAARQLDFDDIVYSSGLNRILVPARESGLYLVEPDGSTAIGIQGTGSVDSADEGRGLLFLLDRSRRTITVTRPADGRVLSSVETSAFPDYVRYVPAAGELWVTEPQASPSGIEIFAFSEGAVPVAHRLGFIVVAGGPEGFTVSSTRGTAYTHAGSELVAIDVATRALTARWPTGCEGTHGFPRIDERHGFVLASCASNGEVSLLNLDDGRQLGRYAVGGGEALPAYSESTGHFYVRSDPGITIATLQPYREGLVLIRQVATPKIGHCLTADNLGHYWTCDSEHGRVLKFDDFERS